MNGGKVAKEKLLTANEHLIKANEQLLELNEYLLKVNQRLKEESTEIKRREESLSYLAGHDPLTGLPNHLLCNDRLQLELSHAERNRKNLALMLIDLDRFKLINDTMGHEMGDKLLQIVAKELARLLRKSDTISRRGGDEFLVVLPEMNSAEDVHKVAHRILEAVRKPFLCEGNKLDITVSIGIAVYPRDAEDVNSLKRNADVAMYRAKEKGRDTYHLYDAE